MVILGTARRGCLGSWLGHAVYLFTRAGRPSPGRTCADGSQRSLELPAALPSIFMFSIRPKTTHFSSRSYSLDVQPHYRHAKVMFRKRTRVYEGRPVNAHSDTQAKHSRPGSVSPQRLRGQGRLIPLRAARIGTCARQICTRRGPPEEACGGINRRRSANRQKSWLDPPQSRN